MISAIRALFTRSTTGGCPRRYTAKRSHFDPNSPQFIPNAGKLQTLADSVDLRDKDVAIQDQGQLGSCTANGWDGLLAFICKKLFSDPFIGSRLMLYYLERERNGDTADDTGAYVSDGAQVLKTNGVCSEDQYPYDITRFDQKPSADCYAAAAQHKLVDPMQVNQDISHIKACLGEGYPIVFGFTVYQSFQSRAVATTGIMPMPARGERILGGHCVEAVGYIDAQGKTQWAGGRVSLVRRIGHALRRFTGIRLFAVTPPNSVIICRNSWGTSWGDKGYFYMPIAYITDSRYASDLWTARTATDGERRPTNSAEPIDSIGPITCWFYPGS